MDARALARLTDPAVRARLIPAGIAFLSIALSACGSAAEDPPVGGRSPVSSTVLLTSPTIVEGRLIPPRYACDRENISPPLHITGVPEGTLELAVLFDDPDAPSGAFSHWVVWGLAPDLVDLPEGRLPRGARQARNSFGDVGYGGPCPPVGESHVYAITVFALGSKIPLADGAPAKDVRAQIAKRSIDQDILTAAYTR